MTDPESPSRRLGGPEEGPPPQPVTALSILETFGKYALAISAVTGVFFTINTGLTNMAHEKTARYAAFRTSIAEEEKAWRALYDDYLTTFESEYDEDNDRRLGKRMTIANFANRDAPSFEEFAVEPVEKKAARSRLQALRASLLNALDDGAASGEAVATVIQARAFEEDNVNAVRPTAEAAISSAPVVKLAPVNGIDYGTKLLSAGRKDGWDIDVFWCRGEGEGLRYGLAREAAQRLADKAATNKAIAPRVILGRIRLRSLPESLQNAGVPKQDVVVHDSGGSAAAEREAAAAVLGQLQPGRFSAKEDTLSPPTRWYLSVFVCA